MRPIDADALIDKLPTYYFGSPIHLLINDAPTIQSDRQHGEWIRISNDWIDGTCGARYFPIRCSVCGYSTYDDNATKFCPNCGAKMYKGGEE